MSLDFDIRFDLKSIASHARRGCCSQPGASLEIDFKSLKGGMSRHKQGLKIDFTCFLVQTTQTPDACTPTSHKSKLQTMEFRVYSLGLRVEGLGCRDGLQVWGLWIKA